MLFVQTGHVQNDANREPQGRNRPEVLCEGTGLPLHQAVEVRHHIQFVGPVGRCPFRLGQAQF